MILKFNRSELLHLTGVTEEHLNSAQDLMGFWVNTDNHRIYCARNTDEGIGHFYLDKEKSEWIFDYLCK